MSAQNAIDKLDRGDFVVGIVGLGYVGLPLTLTFARKGFRVVGFDIDQGKVDTLVDGRSYIASIDGAEIASLIEKSLFEPTTDFGQVSGCDAVILCVPTPLSVNREPDTSYIEATARTIAPTVIGSPSSSRAYSP